MVNFTSCRVSANNLIGSEGGGVEITLAGLDWERLNIVACSVGGAQFCRDNAIDHMREQSLRLQRGGRARSIQGDDGIEWLWQSPGHPRN
jgi:alkylation response protein AidB-like acyl-CoA dehydrogenase